MVPILRRLGAQMLGECSPRTRLAALSSRAGGHSGCISGAHRHRHRLEGPIYLEALAMDRDRLPFGRQLGAVSHHVPTLYFSCLPYPSQPRLPSVGHRDRGFGGVRRNRDAIHAGGRLSRVAQRESGSQLPTPLSKQSLKQQI